MNFDFLSRMADATLITVFSGLAVLWFCYNILKIDVGEKVENFYFQFQQARKAHFYKCYFDCIWGLCTQQAFECEMLDRQVRIARGETVPNRPEISYTMTFSSHPDISKEFLTGTADEMDEFLRDCVVEFRAFYVPFTGCGRKEEKKQPQEMARVPLSEACKIIESARPKLVRNFIRRHSAHVPAILGTLVIAVPLTIGLWYSCSSTAVTQVNGAIHQYAVGYNTRYGHVPIGRTFEELKTDPAVWGIIWTEKTNDPDTELWWDYQCNQGFWGNRCEFVSEGRVVHPSQLGK